MTPAKNQEVTQEQIDAWKRQHGNVMKITVDDKVGYFKTLSRKGYSYASQIGAKDPMQFNEAVLKDCFIGGDEEIITKDSYFMTISTHVTEMLGIMSSSLEKL
ncbi:hypothetical protein [Flavobacterium suncheonense]|uniref:Uncharacterized protein n=1 Tax=Flavobacterium suncheonense GH29-5 = DSM 17707 TaxID=1121899 RepID=A0A0A2MDS4_9FLAO|nr:hypothetical protein [Flavobacterium suncheonense]KGO89736.1 hypothetical protein Q764_05965 [Flavobacterium suncheonense GH29-5 = DSM 17707]